MADYVNHRQRFETAVHCAGHFAAPTQCDDTAGRSADPDTVRSVAVARRRKVMKEIGRILNMERGLGITGGLRGNGASASCVRQR
jgi:hypothetical protein